MADYVDRVKALGKEIGVLEVVEKNARAALNLLEGQKPVSLVEAAAMNEVAMPRKKFGPLTHYWEAHGNLEIKMTLMEALKLEGKKAMA